MKIYEIEFTKSAAKELQKLDKATGKILATAIYGLATNPRPHGTKKLVGQDVWRLRVREYRVVYEIRDSRLLVVILKVAHRREAYR